MNESDESELELVCKATKWAQFQSGLHIIVVFFSGYDGVVPHVCEKNIEISQSKKEKNKEQFNHII